MSAFYRAESEIVGGESEYYQTYVGRGQVEIEETLRAVGIFADPEIIKTSNIRQRQSQKRYAQHCQLLTPSFQHQHFQWKYQL